MPMTHTIACPSCQRPLRVPDDLLGTMVKCPACSHNFPAPAEEPAVAPSQRPSRASAREEDRRPSRRPRDADDGGDRYARDRRRPRDQGADYESDESRRGGQREEKPGKVQAIAIMLLV